MDLKAEARIIGRHKWPSYNKFACCGEDCFMLGAVPMEPCWGDVHAAEEAPAADGDWVMIHECQGHDGCYEGRKKYQPSREQESWT